MGQFIELTVEKVLISCFIITVQEKKINAQPEEANAINKI